MKDKKKKKDTVTIPRLEFRRLKKLDEREIKMKPIVLQLAAYFHNKKIVK